MRTTLRIARKLLLAAFIAGMLVILCASEVEGRQNPTLNVITRADSTIKNGYDTAATENAFCGIVTVDDKGNPWLLGALQAQIVGKPTSRSVDFYCPPTMATIHWHLDTIPNSIPQIASPKDEWSARCYQPVRGYSVRAPFHLIYWKGKYIVYGIRESFPEDYEEICGQR